MEKKLVRRLPKRVTVAWAEKYNPCSRDVMAFNDAFPNGIEITRKNMHMLRKKLRSGAGMVEWLFDTLKGNDAEEKMSDTMYRSPQGASLRKHRKTPEGRTLKSQDKWGKKMKRLRNNYDRKRIDLIADAFNLP